MKCTYCDKEIKPNHWVWVYNKGEDIIHQSCFDEWAFSKLENDLADMYVEDAITKYGDDE